MPELVYHAMACRLLGVKANFSRAAVEAIKEAERKANLPLPASIREWYSLKASDKLSSALTLEHVLNSFRTTVKQAKNGAYQLLIVLDDEHDGGYAITVKPGDDDPEVTTVFEYISHGPELWGDSEKSGKFSDFILSGAVTSSIERMPRLTVLHARYRPPVMIRENVKAGPPHIDFLLENGFEVVWQSRNHVEEEYKFASAFEGPLGRVVLSTNADPWKKFSHALWEIAAKNEEALFNLYELMWPMHSFTTIVQPAFKGDVYPSRETKNRLIARFQKRFPDAKVEKD